MATLVTIRDQRVGRGLQGKPGLLDGPVAKKTPFEAEGETRQAGMG